MDKILRRVRMAERNVARRTKRERYVVDRMRRSKDLKGIQNIKGHAASELGAAIKARHEDLDLGPLAPKRDIFKPDKSGNYWGAITTDRATLSSSTLTDAQREARSAWAGGPKLLCLARGDRVVVTEGPYKGQIAAITQIIRATQSVELEGDVGLTNVVIPSFLLQEGQTAVQQIKGQFPISSVRLVHPLQDPVTGATRDVIIRELKPVRVKHDRPTRKVFFSRVVPGLNVQIPWPKAPPSEREDYADDTLRLEVEERTFVPTLLRPPMPESVLDELRNRYSKFRTRHTPEYIAEVEAREVEKKARRKGARVDEMLLPVQEYNRKMREQRRERGAPELSEEMLEKIGEVIAKNKLARSQGAAAPAEAEVDKLQKAVEELSLGGDAQGTTIGEQPSP